MKNPMNLKHFNYGLLSFILGAAIASLIMLLYDYTLPLAKTIRPDRNVIKYLEDFPQKYQIISPPIPEAMDFCGERVPLESFYVRERMDRELIVNTYYHSATLLGIKRSNRWFPIIDPILKKNGVPEDFRYLALIESNLENVISPAGAVGFWQFTESSAAKYGLEVTSEVDERYNVERSTQAACDYLKFAYNRFHSWTLAAASYNMGIAGIEKQQERQKVKNYYNLLLGEETSRYIARILAMKAISKDPQKYGYLIKPEDLYPVLEYDELKIDSGISNIADFAKQHNLTYKILKIYNPWLRENSLSVTKGKTYMIKMPKNGTAKPISE